MSEGSGNKALAIIIVIALLGIFYLWYTGGSLSLGGRSAYQPLQGIAPMAAPESKSSSMSDYSWLAWLLLGGGALGGLASIGSKAYWGEWNPLKIKKDIIKLNATPGTLIPVDRLQISEITATLQKEALADNDVEFAICERGDATHATFLNEDGDNAGERVTLKRRPGCKTVSVRLKVTDEVNADVRVCARILKWGLGKLPHACTIITIKQRRDREPTPVEPAPPGPRPEPITPDRAPAVLRTLEVTAAGAHEFFIAPGSRIPVKARIKERREGQELLLSGVPVHFYYNTGSGSMDDQPETAKSKTVNTGQDGNATVSLTVGEGRNVLRVEGDGVNNNNGVEIKVWGGEKPNLKGIYDKLDALDATTTKTLSQIEEMGAKLAELEDKAKEALSRLYASLMEELDKISKKLEGLEAASEEQTTAIITQITTIDAAITKITKNVKAPAAKASKKTKKEAAATLEIILSLVKGTGEKEFAGEIEAYIDELKTKRVTLAELQTKLTLIMLKLLPLLEKSAKETGPRGVLAVYQKKLKLSAKAEFIREILHEEVNAILEVADTGKCITIAKVKIDKTTNQVDETCETTKNDVTLKTYLRNKEGETKSNPLGATNPRQPELQTFKSAELLEVTERGLAPLIGPAKSESFKGDSFMHKVNVTSQPKTYVAFFEYNLDLIEKSAKNSPSKRLGIYSNKITIEKT